MRLGVSTKSKSSRALTALMTTAEFLVGLGGDLEDVLLPLAGVEVFQQAYHFAGQGLGERFGDLLAGEEGHLRLVGDLMARDDLVQLLHHSYEFL